MIKLLATVQSQERVGSNSLDFLQLDSKQCSYAVTIALYMAFGAIHELSHVLTAASLGWNDDIRWHDFSFWFGLLIDRRVSFDDPVLENSSMTFFIRHAGWVASVTIALLISRICKSSSPLHSTLQLTASLTAVEAISTDLFGFHQFLPIFERLPSVATFLCGNFGVVLLHHMWMQDNARHALDCLEEMVHVTMMRGAQSGGVVTYQPTEGGADMKGIRARVVNKKRTDLSKEVRKKIRIPKNLPQHFVPTLAGHTRFATSSLSTLDGTHPHQWTPPTKRRVYPLNKSNSGEAKIQTVENYITHNGDFDFYRLNGKTYEIETIQKWLSIVTETPTPAVVDSCAIAGMIDILRCQGSFDLAARYAVCLGMPTSYIADDLRKDSFPTMAHFERIGTIFEKHLSSRLQNLDLFTISNSDSERSEFARAVSTELQQQQELLQPLKNYVVADDGEKGASVYAFCQATINAFFDNDLFWSTQTFLGNATGSFGLVVTSTLDSHRQMVIAARGQTMSIGFFPEKGLICYGSEQAAVKAGLNAHFPGQGEVDMGQSSGDIDLDSTRLDLDDLGGEIVVLDWGHKHFKVPAVSKPNRHLQSNLVMNGKVRVVIHQQSKSAKADKELYHRLTLLTRNEFIKPLTDNNSDPILTDIEDIPRICRRIQDEFHSNKASTGLNRLAAFHLASCLRSRLEARVKGTVPSQAVDILLTGCEVSLWLAEQFASDLQKCFPKLAVQAVSSNKLLGMYGQAIPIPALGFPLSPKTKNYNDAIVLIVSHSGGTFAPLACSNLLQSATKNIFVVAGDWDTQIGKNLRALNELEHGGDNLLNHRIFSTDVGIRPAEPCSISVAATHQLLTNLLEYICVTILSDPRYARVTDAAVTAMDIQVLERCNQMNIDALTEIVGVNVLGYRLDRVSPVLESLRQAGDLWAEHILENARAYIMCFIYISATVISGYPLAYAIAYGAGLDSSSRFVYLVKVIDTAIYFFLPQICIILLRLYQGRNLLHRMVGRTVVIGDIPWVAQAADAFLSKIFAVSYSIAGINVLHGNPADHLVHRHTHRVVRGTLAIFGRPDGRLSALSTAEASVCLSVNQASSIQSRGGTCESITIGHNPFQLDLAFNGIVLKRHRPLFLCERLLVEADAQNEKTAGLALNGNEEKHEGSRNWRKSALGLDALFRKNRKPSKFVNWNASMSKVVDCSVTLQIHKRRSAPALLGAYLNIDDRAKATGGSKGGSREDGEMNSDGDIVTMGEVVQGAILNREYKDRMHRLFAHLDSDHDGFLSREEFVNGICNLMPQSNITETEALVMFRETDTNGSGKVSYGDFVNFIQGSHYGYGGGGIGLGGLHGFKLPPIHRDGRGVIQIEASKEKYFGETMRKLNKTNGKQKNVLLQTQDGTTPSLPIVNEELESEDIDFELARNHHLVQELYETRIASLQRFVSMTVLFHQMGRRVEQFFSLISFGWWGYRMDRTHSIMRIATTASPVSGADLRHRMAHLRLLKKVQHSVDVISNAYLAYKKRLQEAKLQELVRQAAVAESYNQKKDLDNAAYNSGAPNTVRESASLRPRNVVVAEEDDKEDSGL